MCKLRNAWTDRTFLKLQCDPKEDRLGVRTLQYVRMKVLKITPIMARICVYIVCVISQKDTSIALLNILTKYIYLKRYILRTNRIAITPSDRLQRPLYIMHAIQPNFNSRLGCSFTLSVMIIRNVMSLL